ncbi:MAG TPA: iron-siderophore ABC transporter substrate-binding protein [Actinophytocola sp.]|uniref:iron-siderophore ABC transporter substrate-binding protein n=1 Tax=Actinophytocola sp. TaxID=1872138 RepID=UPI002DBDDCAB|nr:iron-siderophore ABC transporter substrate-binding protein [Actinophytocola sp.]HEU5475885.1 iron-siderophore ABC transporter substrate-binding protein [Actinophytocola sp.]
MHRHVDALARRRPVAAALVTAALAAGLLSACYHAETPATSTTSGPAGTYVPAGFPVTVTHKYGTTEITDVPQRVVAAGFRDQEYMLALGMVPVGIRDWYGPEHPYEQWPWVGPALGGKPAPEIHSGFDELNLEKIAALRPDLITTVYSDVSKEVYDQLSKIAPTVAQGAGAEDFTMSWQDETKLIGQSLGRAKQADELIASTEKSFTDAAAAHPEFKGKTIGVLQFGDPGKFYVLNPTDPKARFFTDLGFTVPDSLVQLVGSESNKEVSFERLDLLADLDLVVWLSGEDPDSKALEDGVNNDQLYQSLKSVKEGRDIFLTKGSDALAWGSPLSLPSALTDIVPQLTPALDGKP